jgi:hypothetical protein
MKKAIRTIAAVSLLGAFFVLPGAVAAQSSDRDHDGMPDTWEKHNGLSTTTANGQKDADRDGLKNKAEYRYGFDPRDRDSNNDGVRDNRENAGVIVSFTDGTLTIQKADGSGTVSGKVTDATEIVTGSRHQCTHNDQAAEEQGSTQSHRGEGTDTSGADTQSSGSNDQSGQEGSTGTPADLVAGTRVHEAQLDSSGAFTKIVLIK